MYLLARGQKLRTALTCAIGEESPKDSLVRRFGVLKDTLHIVNFIHYRYTVCYALWPASCHILLFNLKQIEYAVTIPVTGSVGTTYDRINLEGLKDQTFYLE